MSLGPILEMENPVDWCRLVSRLMDEWEVWNEVGLSGRNPGMGNGVVSLLLVNARYITANEGYQEKLIPKSKGRKKVGVSCRCFT